MRGGGRGLVRPGEAGLDPTPVEGKGARPALAIQAPKMLSGAQEICCIMNSCREYFLGPRNSFWAPESRAGRGATASASAGARGRPPASRGPTMRVVRGGKGDGGRSVRSARERLSHRQHELDFTTSSCRGGAAKRF